jgi:MFS family permease
VKEPFVFVYAYSICFGIGKGLMYSSALAAAISHMPSCKGTVTGFVVSGFGFGGFLFGILSNRVCNPDDIETQAIQTDAGEQNIFPAEVSLRVPHMLRVVSITYAVLCLIGLLTVTKFKATRDEATEHLLDEGMRELD